VTDIPVLLKKNLLIKHFPIISVFLLCAIHFQLKAQNDTVVKFNVAGGLYELAKDGTTFTHRKTEATYSLNTATHIPFTQLNDVMVSYQDFNFEEVLILDWSEAAGKAFAEMTKRNIGKEIAIVLNNQVISAPLVHAEITGGKCSVSLRDDKEYFLKSFGLIKEEEDHR